MTVKEKIPKKNNNVVPKLQGQALGKYITTRLHTAECLQSGAIGLFSVACDTLSYCPKFCVIMIFLPLKVLLKDKDTQKR